MEMPPIKYARSRNVSIAYQVTGEGAPLDLILAPGTMTHLALSWNEPRLLQSIERLSLFARLIRFDKRGTGMSDRVTDAATLEERTDDIRAVMEAAGSASAVVMGVSEGGSNGLRICGDASGPDACVDRMGLSSADHSRRRIPMGGDGSRRRRANRRAR
jgi:pimeloyl-ACP methyl ester carboxylesterase